MGEQVIGHYVPAGQETGSSGWQAALAQSTDLFRALVSDDLTTFEKHLGSLGPSAHSSWHTVLFWSASPHAAEENEAAGKVEAVARSRTLAMLATQHGSVRVLSYLLSSGADPTTKAKDGADCYTVGGVAPADPAAGGACLAAAAPACTMGVAGVIHTHLAAPSGSLRWFLEVGLYTSPQQIVTPPPCAAGPCR